MLTIALVQQVLLEWTVKLTSMTMSVIPMPCENNGTCIDLMNAYSCALV